jgi:hypothetical protein
VAKLYLVKAQVLLVRVGERDARRLAPPILAAPCRTALISRRAV